MSLASVGCSEAAATISPSFEVSLLYQDLPTGLHARQLLNHVLDHCELGTEFNLSLWKLDLFHLPEICEQAVLAACGAALVLLSLRGDIGLQSSTQNWLTQWINRRSEEEGALAVLIDCNMQSMDSIGQTLFQLQNITRSSQVRLFVGFVPSVPGNEASSWPHDMQDADPLVLTARNAAALSLPLSEGGINE